MLSTEEVELLPCFRKYIDTKSTAGTGGCGLTDAEQARNNGKLGQWILHFWKARRTWLLTHNSEVLKKRTWEACYVQATKVASSSDTKSESSTPTLDEEIFSLPNSKIGLAQVVTIRQSHK